MMLRGGMGLWSNHWLHGESGAGVGFPGFNHRFYKEATTANCGVFAIQNQDDSELGLKKDRAESFPVQPLELGPTDESGKGKEESVELEMERIRSRRQLMKSSTLIAKQVIAINSALNLGFVSQLWVHTPSWTVLVVEVRPSLLSCEIDRFYLRDIFKVGDVLLLEDEGVMENDFNLLGMETLVGYNVVTPGQRSIGKVRGYTFDINSGSVESLELDSFGMSIIPSSLVSTYVVYVEDVVEVSADTVVVHEAAASRIQRLTKGVWGKKMGSSRYKGEEYGRDEERRELYSRRSNGRGGKGKKFVGEEEWELPMDYLS